MPLPTTGIWSRSNLPKKINVTEIIMSYPRIWLAFANEQKCKHQEALKELGFISWTSNMTSKFAKNDIVYLFMSDVRAVRYKLRVDIVNVPREDKDYWIEPAPDDLTYRLTLLEEYSGEMLKETILKMVGFHGGSSIMNPSYNNIELMDYINSVFKIASSPIKLPSKYIVVDLGSGRYLKNNIGHEIFNLVPNEVDGRFYGYLPPHDNPNIKNLGASKTDNYVDDVMIVYVQKLQNSNNRKIVAFTNKAQVYSKRQSGAELNRYINNDGKHIECTYTIVSDYIYDLQLEPNPFIFEVRDNDAHMFRQQRFYAGRRPKQEVKMLLWLTDYLITKNNSEDDDLNFQAKIQASEENIAQSDTSKEQPTYNNGTSGRTVAKKANISKQALRNAKFKCIFDESHETFLTNKGLPYMEGHHLIPCTVSNVEYFWSKYGRNIDCVENIISLCPTCHRRIHFGNQKEKEMIIQSLYDKQISKLKIAGIDLSVKDLLDLYK